MMYKKPFIVNGYEIDDYYKIDKFKQKDKGFGSDDDNDE